MRTWARGDAGGARTRPAGRPASSLLAAAGVILLAVTGLGCGHGTNTSSIAAVGNSTGCPTQGVGGDTVAPACIPQAQSPSTGITPPPVESSPAPGITAPPVATPVPSITAPYAPSSPAPGITAPYAPSSPPPEAAAPPQVTSVSPASGAAAGGDTVTITGSGFTRATAVEFGGVSAEMSVDSDAEITATSPPGTGTVDITVVTPAGASAAGASDQFSYAS
jgi:IPT/TIG domain